MPTATGMIAAKKLRLFASMSFHPSR